MKAVLLARVSTQEQAQGHSIEAQMGRLRDYCQRKNLTILKEFPIIESSSKGDRKEFKEMIEFIKKQKTGVALVAEAVDRIQRGFRESVLLTDMVELGQVCLHFNKENLIINQNSNPSEILRWDFSVLGAKSYALDISHNTKRSLVTKLEKGELTRIAPIGYLNVKDANGKSEIIVDKTRSLLVKEMFEMYATGKFAIGDLIKFAKKNNLTNTFFKNKKPSPVSGSVIIQMLCNPFYYGEMYVKKYNKSYPHKYETLITRDLFERCQQVKKNRADKNNRTQVVLQTAKKDFIFRGLLKCAVTGRTISSDIKKDKHVYLITWDPENTNKKMYVNENKILKILESILKSIEFPEALLTAINKQLHASYLAEKEYRHHKINQILKAHEKAMEKLSMLLDMRLENKISDEVYEAKSKSLKEELAALEAEKKVHIEADDKFNDTIITAFTLASKAYSIFKSSKIPEKRNLLAFMFSNLQLKGENLEFSLKKPFSFMVNLMEDSTWLPKGFYLRTVNGAFDESFYSKMPINMSLEERLKFIATSLDDDYITSTKIFLKDIEITGQLERLRT